MHYYDASSSPFTRWAAARTERFVAVSDYVRRVLEETAPALAPRLEVVRNGVDTAYFQAPGADGAHPFRIGIVCRLTSWKRVHLAIEAAVLSGAELLVVGDGEERARLEALARRRGAQARFVGFQPDPRPFVTECDVIVSTSDSEPLGLTVLEALSMERPVIAFAQGGVPEIVHHQATGWLVADPTAAALAVAIDEARDRRSSLAGMGAQGRRFVVDHCSVEAMCRGYAAAYERTSRASPPRAS
jgi:glycosyltransferase involved in cell wall biosynthesis